MNADDIIIRCLNCGTKNRIPKNRFQEHPVCGRCHATLDDMIIRCLSCGTKNRMPENRLNAHPLCGRCGEPLVVDRSLHAPVEVTDSTFLGEVLTSPRSVLVDCWAPWCGPCRSLAPILEELAVKYGGGIKIAKMNVDENPLTAQQFNVRNIPTMLLFRNGKLVNTLVGLLPKEEIERHLLSIMETS
jgi:thioredoxin 2